MMKRFVASSVLSTAIAAFGLASTAVAETWSPTGPVSLSSIDPMSGAPSTLQVSKGITLDCGLSGGGSLAGSSALVNSLSLTAGDFLCIFVAFSNLPYNLEPEGGTSLDSVTLEDVVVTAVTGNCRGNLTGDFDQTNGRITFTNATIPSDPVGGSPCVINGVVATSPAVSYTIP